MGMIQIPILQKINSITLRMGNSTERLEFHAFRVDRKVVENTGGSICSFYLKPEHGKPLPSFLPGQFLTFRLDLSAGAWKSSLWISAIAQPILRGLSGNIFNTPD